MRVFALTDVDGRTKWCAGKLFFFNQFAWLVKGRAIVYWAWKSWRLFRLYLSSLTLKKVDNQLNSIPLSWQGVEMTSIQDINNLTTPIYVRWLQKNSWTKLLWTMMNILGHPPTFCGVGAKKRSQDQTGWKSKQFPSPRMLFKRLRNSSVVKLSSRNFHREREKLRNERLFDAFHS